MRGRPNAAPHSSHNPVCPLFLVRLSFLSFPSLLLSFLFVSPPILRSCSSYFNLLPGARRSVPDGNSLRLQEPPWRPHGGGTGGEQSGPVLPCYPSFSFSPSPMYFFLLFPLLFFFPLSSLPSFPLTPVSLSVSSVSSLPGYTGPQGDLLLARVPQHRALSSFTHRFPSTPPSFALIHPPSISLHSPPSFSSTLPWGKTVRPSSPELSISEGVYLQRDRPTHLERIFTSVHTFSHSHSLLALYIS